MTIEAGKNARGKKSQDLPAGQGPARQTESIHQNAGSLRPDDRMEFRTIEEALQASEIRFHTLFTSMSEGFALHEILCDEQGRPMDYRFLEVNPAFEKLTGLSREQVLGKTVRQIMPEIEAVWIETYGRVALTGEPVRLEEFSGSVNKYFEVYAYSPVRGQFAAIFMDVTARKEAEKILWENHAKLESQVKQRTGELQEAMHSLAAERKRFHEVLDTLPAYVILLTPDYHVSFANRYFEERFGKSGGKRCYEYLFGRTEPCLTCETYTVLKTGKPHHWEWNGPDDRIYDISDFLFPDADGSNLILEMGIDITEQIQAQKALHATFQYARSLLEASLDPLVTINTEGKITDVNQATERATGFSREQLVGTDFSDYFSEPQKAREGYERAFAEGSVTDYPLTIRHRDGRRTDVLYNATIYKNEADEVQGVFAAARDITEKKAAESELERYRQHLEELVRQRTKELEQANTQLQEEIRQRQEAQESLTREQANLQAVFNIVNVGMILIDEKGCVKRINNTISRWVGRNLPEGICQQPGDLVGCINALTDAAGCGQTAHCAACRIRQTFESVLETGQPLHDVETETVLLIGGSEIRLWLEINADPLRLDGRQHVILALNNITDRKHAEQELQRSSERYELLAQTTGTLLQAADPQTSVESLCRRVMEYLHCQVFFNFLVDEQGERLHLNAYAGIEPHQARQIEWLDYGVAVCGCVARDGCRIVAEHLSRNPDPRTERIQSYGIQAYACHPLINNRGEVIGTLSFGTRDRETFRQEDLSLMKAVADHVAVAITRMKEQQILQQSEAQLKLAQVSAGAGTWDWDMGTGRLKWSEELFGLFGLDPHQAEASFDAWKAVIQSDDRQYAEEQILTAIEQRIPLTSEYRIVLPSGDIRWINALGNTTYDAGGQPLRMSGICLDITQRKAVENALANSEQRIQQALRVSHSFTFEWEVATDQVIRSKSCETVLKLSGREAVHDTGQHYFQRIHPDDRERFVQTVQGLTPAADTYIVEYRVIGGDNTIVVLEETGQGCFDSAGRLERLVGVTTDITLRKLAEEALVVSETRYRRLFETARDGIIILDAESGQIVDVNLFLKEVLGYSHEEFLNKKIWEIGLFKHMVESKEAFLELQTKGYIRFENLPLETKDGRIMAVEFVSNVYLVDHGKVIQCNIRDITARKQAEEALRQSRNDLARAQEVANVGSWRLNLQTNELAWSEQLYRIFGISPGTPLNYETFLSRVYPEDRPYVNEQWRAALRGDKYDLEHRIIVHGQTRWVRERAFLELDTAGIPLAGFGITQDITALKKYEEEITSLAKFPSENPFPVLRISSQGEILYTNGPGTTVLEYWARQVGQTVPDAWRQLVAEVIRSGRDRVEEIRHRDHTYSLVLTAIAGMNYMNMYGRDITAQRKAEQELQQSHDQLQAKVRERTAELGRMVKILQDEVRQRIQVENQLRESSEMLDAFYSHSITPLVILDRNFNFVRVNAAYARGCGRKISEFAGHNHFELYPNVENQKIFETVVQTRVPYQVTAKPFIFPDHPEWGITYWDWNLNPLLNEAGEVEYLVFSLQDVTQRQQAELALQESEEKYRHLVELLPEAIFVISEGKITYVNRAAVHILKAAGEEPLLGAAIQNFVTPDSMEFLNETLQNVHGHWAKIAPREIQAQCLDGSVIDVEISASPIQLSGVPGDLLIFRDIAEQKYQQQLIRQSEMRLSEAQHIAHLGNWEWDLASDEIWCSDEVYSIFGLAPQETRLTLELIIAHTHPEDRDLVRRAIEETRSQGKGFLLHHRIMLADQTERIVQVRAEHHGQSPVQQPGLRGTIQDVTEQKKNEAELRESQRKLRSLAAELEKVGEKERRQIAVDLHDSIGQILAFSARELKGLQKILPEHFSQTVQEVTRQLDLAVKQTRTLSFDLSPSILYDLGLEQALEELTERFAAEKKIACTYESDGLAVALPDPIKILLYRAVRELLINVSKHAQATEVKVSLRSQGRHLQIRVEDNGRGLAGPAPEELPIQDRGFGLYSIGERLDHIGGKLEMESVSGRGVKVLLTVPLAMELNIL